MHHFSFCPHARCAFHITAPDTSSWFSRFGSYHTKTFGTVQRFICHACHHTFSTQSFSPSYYLKASINLPALFSLHASSISGRALSRFFLISPSAIQNRIDRLARQALSLPPHVVHHIRIPASLPRTSANPLFPSNYIDRELRKDQANHRRETTCFSRNVANGLTRLICYLVHHNYWKRYLIKARPSDTRTHGTCAGIPPDEQRRGILTLFSQRAFLSREDWLFSPTLRRIWLKQDPTPGKQKPDYLPRFAWA